MAETMITFACLSNAMISFKPWIPSISGITISMVTASGLNSLYFSNASLPFPASPATREPWRVRIRLINILMTLASSTTNIFLIHLLLNYLTIFQMTSSPGLKKDNTQAQFYKFRIVSLTAVVCHLSCLVPGQDLKTWLQHSHYAPVGVAALIWRQNQIPAHC